LLGPFDLVAKFPQAVPQAFLQRRQPIPVLLGLNFFADIRAKFEFQCFHPPDAGTIEV
jgi:hypothetical protein